MLIFFLLIFLGILFNSILCSTSEYTTRERRYEVDISWDFDDGDRQGWGNATADETEMEIRVEQDELRCNIVGHEPKLDSPPIFLDVTRRHYVVFRMMYYGSADSARLMMKSGASRIKSDRIDFTRSYWTNRVPPIVIGVSNEQPGRNKEYAIDGNSDTYWEASPAIGAYIDLDIKEARWISAVKLTPLIGDASPERCYLQRSRFHSTGPFETVGDFVVRSNNTFALKNNLTDTEQWFGGINAFGRYWRLLIMNNHGGATTGFYDIELHGADEDISVANFEVNNALDNTGAYKNYYIPINQFVSGPLLRMRLHLFKSSSPVPPDLMEVRNHVDGLSVDHVQGGDQSVQHTMKYRRYREGLSVDYVRVIRAPEVWRVRGCLDIYSAEPNFANPVSSVNILEKRINGHLPIRYFEKKNMTLQYAKTYDCPVDGGVDIQIDGLNFGPNARVFVGSSLVATQRAYGSGREEDDGRGHECIVHQFSRDESNGRLETLVCRLPKGSPGSKLIRVENGKLPGIFQQAPLFSYRTAPPVPERPRLTNLGAHRVDLVWDPPGDYFSHNMVTGYKVLWFEPLTPYIIHNLTLGNVTTTSVRGLRPGTEYVFAVAAVSEGAHNERSANLTTDLYGRRDLTGEALVGTFSSYTNARATLEFDFDFAGFDANKSTNSGSVKNAESMTSYGPTGSQGTEGNYGIVLVGSANVQNCNGSSTCCDGYNATIGLSSCGSVCATYQSRRLAFPTVIGGVTRRQVPSNIPYADGSPPEKVITTLAGLGANAEAPSSRCGPALRLTPSEARQSGSAWYNRKMNVREGFETTFKFEISNPSMRCDRLDDVNTYCRSRGADGIAFVLQDESAVALGNAGSGLGYEGIYNSLAIELDTYMNYDNLDPYENHISVLTQGWRFNITANHSRSLADTTRIPDLTDGIHTVRIKYDPNFDMDAVPHPSFQTNGYTTWFLENADFKNGGEGDWGTGFGLLYVYVDDLYSPVLTTPLNLESTLKMDDGRMYVGLTSATGNSNWQVHDILEWQFRSLFIDRKYEPPVIVNGYGDHQCRDESVCVHHPNFEEFMRINNIMD